MLRTRTIGNRRTRGGGREEEETSDRPRRSLPAGCSGDPGTGAAALRPPPAARRLPRRGPLMLPPEDVSRSVTSPQFAVLNALLREPGLDQQTLGSRVALDRSTVAEVVARLTERDLVRWRRDTADGRRKVIELTPRGEEVLQELIPRTHEMTRRLVRGLRPDEESDLLRL